MVVGAFGELHPGTAAGRARTDAQVWPGWYESAPVGSDHELRAVTGVELGEQPAGAWWPG